MASVEFNLKRNSFFINRSKKYEVIYEYFFKNKSFSVSE